VGLVEQVLRALKLQFCHLLHVLLILVSHLIVEAVVQLLIGMVAAVDITTSMKAVAIMVQLEIVLKLTVAGLAGITLRQFRYLTAFAGHSAQVLTPGALWQVQHTASLIFRRPEAAVVAVAVVVLHLPTVGTVTITRTLAIVRLGHQYSASPHVRL
jgi:hypothetical protein